MESNFIDGMQIGFNKPNIFRERPFIVTLFMTMVVTLGIAFIFYSFTHIDAIPHIGGSLWLCLISTPVVVWFVISNAAKKEAVKLKGERKYFYYNDGIANDNNIKLPWGMFSFVKISDRKCSIVIKKSEKAIDFELQSNLGVHEVLEVLNKKISENQVQLTDEEIKENSDAIYIKL